MTFNLQLRLPVDSAESSINKVGAGLTGLERKVVEVGAIFGRSMDGAAESTDKAAGSIEREARMLELATGKSRNFADNMETLAKLHNEGKINADQYTKSVEKLGHQFEQTAKAAEDMRRAQAKQASSTIGLPTASPSAPTASAMGGLAAGAAAAGIGVSVYELAGMADAYTNIQNRLRLMAGDQEHANALFGELQGIAGRTRSDLGATVDAFAGMSRATKSLGLSQTETLQVTETLNKLVTISGKSATESAAGLMQFSQALSSGRLQGDELRSVFENMPSLVDALTSSLGVSQAGLRMMGEQGLITSRVMVTALQQAASGVDASMGKTIPTISQSWTVLKNQLMVTVGELNQSAGITTAVGETFGQLASVVKVAAGAFEKLGPVVKALDYINPISWGKRTIGALAGMVSGFFEVDKVAEVYEKRQYALTEAMEHGSGAIRQWVTDQTELNLRMTLGASAADAFAKKTTDLANAAKLTASEFRDLFMAGDALAQFGKISRGGFKAPDDIDKFNKIAAGGSVENAGTTAARKYIDDRKAAVAEATTMIEGLDQAFAAGGIKARQYGEEHKRLRAIIDDTANAVHREKKKHEDILATIRAEVAARESLAKYKQDEFGFRKGEYEYGLKAADKHGWEDSQYDDKKRMEQIEKDERAQKEMNDAVRRHNEERRKIEEAAAKKQEEDAQRVANAWAAGAGRIGASLVEAFIQGKQSGSEMFASLLQQLAVLAMQTAAMQMGGSGGAFLTAAAGAIGHFATGGSFTAPSGGGMLLPQNIPHAANGGTWMMGGQGGTDSQLAMLWMTPRETATIQTPEQRRAGNAPAAQAPVHVRVVNQYDKSTALQALDSPQGERVIANVIRRNPGLVRSLSGR